MTIIQDSRRFALAIAVVVLAGLPAAAAEGQEAAAEIIGAASVIDGDTLEIRDRRIRLDGIDAPESTQLCLWEGRKERCGQASAFFLADLIGRRTLRCVPHDVDRYGRDTRLTGSAHDEAAIHRDGLAGDVACGVAT